MTPSYPPPAYAPPPPPVIVHPPKKSHGLRWLVIVIIGIALGVGAAQRKKEKEAQKAEVASGTASVDVSADQLWRDYKANEVSADDKYRGKVLRVHGAVKRIAKDIADDPYVTLDTSDIIDSVDAHFDSDSALGSLRKGQQVTLRCRGNNVVLGSPQLSDCVLD